MPEKDIDLERAVQDPVYRRQIIERLNAEAAREPSKGAEASVETDTATDDDRAPL